MIPYSATLLAVAGARTGLPPVNLLDVQDTNGNIYHWADRKNFLAPVLIGEGVLPYVGWLLSCGPFVYNRSLVTDFGSFVIQNVSGDTLSRDMEKTLRGTTLEGAQFAYRCWQADAQAFLLYGTGTLTFDGGSDDLARFKTKPFGDAAQEDTPLFQLCETCQLNWAGPRCGSTKPTECSYSFQSCQVPERFMGVINSFEKNYGETTSDVPLLNVNRSRRI